LKQSIQLGDIQPGDAIYAAEYLRRLRDQPHQAFEVPRHQVTTFLVDALAFQVELETGNVMQNIGEMAVLCRELLTLEMSDVDITHSITLLASAVLSKIRPEVLDQPLDQLIECLRAARMRKPDLHIIRRALVLSLNARYIWTFLNSDYEEAASIVDEFTTSSSPGDSQSKFVAEAQCFITSLARVRSDAHGAPEFLEETLYRTHAFLSSSFAKEHKHSHPIVYDLENTAKQRFHYFGSIEGIEASSSNSPLSQPVPEVPFFFFFFLINLNPGKYS